VKNDGFAASEYPLAKRWYQIDSWRQCNEKNKKTGSIYSSVDGYGNSLVRRYAYDGAGGSE